ncbi:MAG: hypothetical protein GX660_07220 [Clostridiaceae bacterium]|jgi:hypothetical protein|nr:hypothetical protein [Clostridiaceae bacterium]
MPTVSLLANRRSKANITSIRRKLKSMSRMTMRCNSVIKTDVNMNGINELFRGRKRTKIIITMRKNTENSFMVVVPYI